MPWCHTCDRFLSPSTVSVEGSCPSCGTAVDPGSSRARRAWAMPWHFKVVLGVLAVYLGYRTFQGIEWLIGQL